MRQESQKGALPGKAKSHCLINAVTGEVKFRKKHMSGYPTNQDLTEYPSMSTVE